MRETRPARLREPDARGAAGPDLPEERGPRVVALGVHDGDAEHVPPAVRVAAYRGDDRGRRDAALAPALDVRGVQPQVGHVEKAQGSRLQLLDLGVQARAYGARLVLREPLDPIASATLRAFRVLVPVAHISATAATSARSTRRQRSRTSSGKKLPERSFGMRSASVPTHVTGLRSR